MHAFYWWGYSDLPCGSIRPSESRSKRFEMTGKVDTEGFDLIEPFNKLHYC